MKLFKQIAYAPKPNDPNPGGPAFYYLPATFEDLQQALAEASPQHVSSDDMQPAAENITP
jgi:hypothetical protein